MLFFGPEARVCRDLEHLGVTAHRVTPIPHLRLIDFVYHSTYLWLIDFVYHSTLGLRVIKREERGARVCRDLEHLGVTAHRVRNPHPAFSSSLSLQVLEGP